jgi:hypothetical protein
MSSVRGDLEKAKKDFHRQVPTKLERCLFAEFLSASARGTFKPRLFALTHPCLYLCKAGFNNTAKICHRYSWIALRDMAISNPDILVFRFEGLPNLELKVENPTEFRGKIQDNLRFFWPPWHPFLTRPSSFGNQPLASATEWKPKLCRKQFINLLVSQRYISSDRFDPTLITKLEKQLTETPGRFSLRTINPDPYSRDISADLAVVLRYAVQLYDIDFCGGLGDHPWLESGKIVEANQDLKEIEVRFFEGNSCFDSWMEKLSLSRIEAVTFEQIAFSSKMLKPFASNAPRLHVSDLTFIDCQFTKTGKDKKGARFRCLADCFLEPDAFNCLKCLSIREDQIHAVASLQLICHAAIARNLEVLCLEACEVDIHAFFGCLAQSDIRTLKRLDLSGNVCPSGFAATAELPASITSLRLVDVRWEGRSLLTFLGKQSYGGLIELDLSGPTLARNETDDSLAHELKERITRPLRDHIAAETPSPNIRSIRWNGNPLFPGLLTFFGKMEHLETLSIAKCAIAHDDKPLVARSLVEFLGKRKITSLKISETFRDHAHKVMEQLQEVLSNHPTLVGLDVSGNCLHEEGLDILGEILRANPRIVRIAFDVIKLKNSLPLKRFFETLLDRPALKKVKRPQAEIEALTKTMSERESAELEQAWEQLALKVKNTVEPITDESTTDASLWTTSDAFPSAVSVPGLAEDWDVKIPSVFVDTTPSWRALRRQFTFERITGVATGLRPDDDLLSFA